MKRFLTQIPYRYVQLLLLFVTVGILLFEAQHPVDMRVFLAASKDIMAGKDVYKLFYFGWLDYVYSPLFGILMVPLTCLPEYWANFSWLVLSIVALVRILHILSHWLEIDQLDKVVQRAFFWLCILICLRLIRDNIHYHQITIIMAYLSLEGLHQIFKKNSIRGGAILALGINIKLLPLVFIPYLIYRKEWLGLGTTLAFCLFYLYLPVLVLGLEYNNLLLSSWWDSISPSKHASALDFNKGGIGAIITALFYQEQEHSYALFITMLPESTIQWISHSLRLFFVLLTLYFLRTLPFKESRSKEHRFWEIAYLFLVTPIIFPRQQNYAFFYVLPAIYYLLYFFYANHKGLISLSKKKRNGLWALCFIAYFCLSAELLLGAFMAFYISIKLVTWGAILLIIPFSICHPKAFEK